MRLLNPIAARCGWGSTLQYAQLAMEDAVASPLQARKMRPRFSHSRWPVVRRSAAKLSCGSRVSPFAVLKTAVLADIKSGGRGAASAADIIGFLVRANGVRGR